MREITGIDRRHFISGALAAAAALGIAGNALASEGSDSAGSTADASAQDASAQTSSGTADAQEHAVEIHRGYAAAHGDKCFTQVVVAVSEGTVVAASIDDYQFLDNGDGSVTAVPNSDASFGEGYATPTTQIASKTDNHEAYSAHMAEKGGATQDWLDSIRAIEDFVAGQTPEDLLATAEKGISGEIGIDTVSGATLADTFSYINAVATIASDDTLVSTGTFSGDVSGLTLGRANLAAHGDKCFADVVTLAQGQSIVAASVDEFQFLDATTEGISPVPNSDGGFGENYAQGVVLCSKSVCHEAYSAHMAEKGGATQDWLVSMQAIEDGVAGMGIVETPALTVDTISGSTLASTTSYAAACGISAALSE